jgi:hypothetical protein
MLYLFPGAGSKHRKALQWALAFGVALSVHAPVAAQADEARAYALAAEVGTLITEATGVIGALQSDINSGHAADKVAPEALLASFQARYAKAVGKPFDEKGEGADATLRKSFASALRETFTKFQPMMAKGGTDAFVPAFFRAELLKRFNAQMKGKVQAYATNREKEIINADWTVGQVMKGSPLIPEVTALMNAGGLTPVTKRAGDRVMGYWPMKLGAACVACHARNNLQQKEGEFGGALVAEVWIK